jgi:hypothetical protein
MKSTKIFYWIFTLLMIGLMGFGAIPNILSTPESAAVFSGLGYPLYIMPFIGTAKLLGAIVILIPGLNRLKEWVYAGFVYDLSGAGYSTIMMGEPFSAWVFFILFLGIVVGSYIFHRKRLAEQGQAKL